MAPPCILCSEVVYANQPWGQYGDGIVHLACDDPEAPRHCKCGVMLRARRTIIVDKLHCPLCGRPATNVAVWPVSAKEDAR